MAEEALEAQERRLEDYIALAKRGEEVGAEVALRKQAVLQKTHPEETRDSMGEISLYLLLADFALTAKGETRTVSKVYAFGAEGESPASARVNRSIASARLKMDYKRLEEAGIAVEERYF